MDQYLSTVIIAIISGVFSTISLIIQRKQDKVIRKIDEQAIFIEKEKMIKRQLLEKENERDNVIYEIILLILDTNIKILENFSEQELSNNTVFNKADELHKKYDQLNQDIENIAKEYEVVLEMTEEFQEELERIQNKKNNK